MPKFFEDESAQENLSKSLLAAARGVDETGNQTVIPVVREELVVSKRVVETGQGIRVTKTVSEREEIVDELLARDDVVFERVSLNQVVAATEIPDVRYEGETMIVPILEEILVVEKRTILKEELRISRRHYEVREPQRVVLRSEEVSIEQFDERSSDAVEPPGNTGIND
ncbi:MAG: YsnF/AvaK domain-containing protein [Burkholderiales bacterium]|nr:YsnF/AvaK domain-containing protein [Burkholderiales bacterium]